MSTEKRTLIAVALMALVLFGWQALFAPAPPPRPEAPPTAERPSAQGQPDGQPGQVAAPAPTQPQAVVPLIPAQAPPKAPAAPQRVAMVRTPLYEAAVSSEGGKLQSLTLHYRGEKPLVVLGEVGPAGLVMAPQTGQGAVVSMEMSAEALTLGPDKPEGRLQLDGQLAGLRVRQTLGFDARTYTIDTMVRIENPGTEPRTVTVSLPWITRQKWGEEPEKFTGQHPTEIVWSTNGRVGRAEDLCQVPEVNLESGWIATGSIWYMAALIPRTEGFRLLARAEPNGCDPKAQQPTGRATIAAQASPTIAPGQAWEGRVTVFVGPKEYDRLAALGLEDAINFGGFPVPQRYGGLPMEWLGVPILLLMNWVYDHVGNYGIAIILLTVLSKVLFYPLTVKSMRSMKAMQMLQPQVNALRNKYRSDPQRLQRETMELYRQHKVNPLGGCLPMIAQIPIFYALYLALSVSVELQNAGFLCFGRLFGMDLWICDLASQDPTYVLPILMGVTMFIQQKMTPVAGDPRQAKMMLFMPFVFTFMFLNLPSGLVLYWTVSNILQILQQWYMDRGQPAQPARPAREPKPARA
ncbi:MAG TPA: membrane protein insertase YidC [Candidatus Tectomicrobia bacterium]|nr:membrane protein insertase YidC [Candidatus Tectomicrobia bacterium]